MEKYPDNHKKVSLKGQGIHQQEFSKESLFTMAVYFQNNGEHEKAVDCLINAIALDPDFAEAFYNIGVIRYGQSAWKDAIYHFEKALTIRPEFVDAAFNLAAAYKEAGHYHQAVGMYQKVLSLNSAVPDAYFYQGICYLKLGHRSQAVLALQQAVALDQSNASFWFHLAEAQFVTGNLTNAIASYRKTIARKPDWESAHYNLAVALRMENRMDDAIDHLKHAIKINPYFSKAYPFLFRLAQHTCDWPLAEAMNQHLNELTPSEIFKGMRCAESPLTSIRRTADVSSNLQVAANWSLHISQQIASLAPQKAFTHSLSTSPRIRIGYLSNDFKDHAVAHQIRGMLSNHDRSKFEIFGYATNPEDGTRYRRLLSEACDHFTDVHAISDPAAAEKIHMDGIHILVDLSGHSRNSRLGIAALRPANINVSYLGFLATTGADFIDYVLADAVVVPENHISHYSEKIVYLPHCYQVNDDQLPISQHSFSRREFNLPDDGFVFCCFNQPYKIDRQLFTTWLSILKQVDQSVLWLVERSPIARKKLRRAAQEAHIDPDRLIFTGFVPLADNLSRLRLADLVLDTQIYNGGATTSNALWAGVPVLTTLGTHWVSRMSASALTAIGLPELIAESLNYYAEMAVDLATNRAKLDALREKLQLNQKSAPLFKTTLFTRHIEKAFHQMWHRKLAGSEPESFKIEP